MNFEFLYVSQCGRAGHAGRNRGIFERPWVSSVASVEFANVTTVFYWPSDCLRAFPELKDALTFPPVLRNYNSDAPLEVHMDASRESIGVGLAQCYEGDSIKHTALKASQRYANQSKITP